MTGSVFEQYAVDDGGLHVELLVQPAINYALVHNRVPPVRRLAVANTGSVPVTDLDVRLDLYGPAGLLTPQWRRTVTTTVKPGGSIGWEDFGDFSPSMAQLRGADEAFPADYRLAISRPGHPDLQLVAHSTVLAHNEWFNSPVLYDSLAAFVQPNTKAVEAVLRAAAQILLERTGSGALQGYQAGPERAAHIAGGIYEALRALGIHYQGLPASFENTGQKVRTTGAVLDGRLGNCVDLSVTYAACLEAAGLHPLIWLMRGHAFAGFLVEEERLGAAALTEPNMLLSMVESGKAVPVELTKIGPGAPSVDFTGAVGQALAHFRAAGTELHGVIDVFLAHRSGIRPLPSSDTVERPPAVIGKAAVPAAGSIELPAGVARTRLRESAEADEAPGQPDDSPLRVQQWKKALLDLSLRNPLLNMPRSGRGLELHVPAGALALLDDLIHDGKHVEIVPQDAISTVHQLGGVKRAQDLDPQMLTGELRSDRRIYGAVPQARYKSLMRGLQREARTMEQETGSNYLYLTLGTLVHDKGTAGEAHAPLFLLPVRIEGGTGRRPYYLVVDGSEIATPNNCLIEWLRIKHSVQIPELEQPARDDRGIDIPKTLAAINARLVENRLNYRIDETASLRLLNFSTFQMWRDLTDHWQTFIENPVVSHLVTASGATFDDPAGNDHDPAVDEADLHLPIPADGSQMQAIVMAERGHSFVLEGPPGTGKSQTITNLIARAVVSGRSVLFVAEKQAALDVVKRRLKQIGLGPFTLDLHGRRQSITAIREQLREALDQDDHGDEAGWNAVDTGFRGRLAPLVGYPARVHATNAAGMSAWSAYDEVLAYGEGVTAPVPVDYLAVSAETRRRIEQTLRELPTVAQSARLRRDHPWALSGRRSVEGMQVEAAVQIATDLEALRAALAADADLAQLARALPVPDAGSTLLPAARLASRGLLPDHATTSRALDRGWGDSIAQIQGELRDLQQAYAAELKAFRPTVLGVAELPAWQQEATEAEGRMFGKGKHLQAVADKLAPYAMPGTTVDPEGTPTLLGRLIAARTAAASLLDQVRRVGGVRLPRTWLPTDPNAERQLGDAVQASVTSRALLAERPGAWALIANGFDERRYALLDRLVAVWRAWRQALSCAPSDFTRWAGEPSWYDAWQRDGARWVSDLRTEALLPVQRWGALLARVDVLTSAGLTEFGERILRAQVDAGAAEEAYRRGVAATSLAERMNAGELGYFDPDLHNSHVTQFESAAGRLRSALPDHLPSVLIQRRPFQKTERRGRFAELAAELRRKRGGKSFRELFANYSDVVLALTPCVLVSPASAATFLSPDAARFDIVVFDEASQIRVAEAIGAMGRGRSVVVVGDSRQMPPTTIMQASHVGEDGPADDGPVPEDLDSILSESVESGLPQRWLSWHYRSQDESLIAFSNRYYYDNKLSSLPSPATGGLSAGVSWRRVDGVFDRGGARTNEVEAAAVVAEIARRLRDPLTAGSIGVVTFNIQQRDLILNMLEDSSDPLIRAQMTDSVPEPIFVKNLENVQGDERDAILFSLAFSTSPQTGQLPLNFGPLSQAGGERRLNVAITRARRQVVLFASFDPSDIDLTRTSAMGTKHLRAYCEMAAAGVDRLGDLAAPRHERRDRIRDEVASAIRQRGHEVVTGHGLSDFTVDLAVRAPGAERWQVAVMLDSPQWSRRPTVADRDGAPTLLRTIMGWAETVRFWLPAWMRDRSELLAEVDAAVARTQAAEAAAREAEAAAEADAGTAVEPVVAEPLAESGVEPAAEAEPVGDDAVLPVAPLLPPAPAASDADEVTLVDQPMVAPRPPADRAVDTADQTVALPAVTAGTAPDVPPVPAASAGPPPDTQPVASVPAASAGAPLDAQPVSPAPAATGVAQVPNSWAEGIRIPTRPVTRAATRSTQPVPPATDPAPTPPRPASDPAPAPSRPASGTAPVPAPSGRATAPVPPARVPAAPVAPERTPVSLAPVVPEPAPVSPAPAGSAAGVVEFDVTAVTSIAPSPVADPPVPAAPAVGTARPAGPTVFVPYQPTVVGAPSDLDDLATNEATQATIRQTLRQVVTVEGPVEIQRLARLVLARYGLAKPPESRRSAVLGLIDPSVLRAHPVGTYAWPAGLDPATWRGFRASRVAADRDLSEVAPEEVANAITYALQAVPNRVEEDLLRTALDLLGYKRKTEKADQLLRYGLQLAYRAGRLTRGDDGRYGRPA